MSSHPHRTTIPPEAPQIGERYQLLKKLGSGGMGAVFQAEDKALEKTVAVKILLPGLDSDTVIRFQQEARATAKLDHPNIVKVLDFGETPSGELYLVMDYVGARSLEDLIKKSRRLPLGEALPVFIQIAAGLQHAHSHKILHRDVKPSNIMLSEKVEGNVQIVDFGLAKLQSDDQKLTSTGVHVGSPLYMSPEQAGSDQVDERSDIYSLGCLMFKALTGSPPLQGETYMDTIMMQKEDLAPLLNDMNCGTVFPDEIENIVARTLEKHPDDRFQSARELKHALMNALETYAATPAKIKPVGGADSNLIPGSAQGAHQSMIDRARDFGRAVVANRVPILIAIIVLIVLPLSLFGFLLTDRLGETKTVPLTKLDDQSALNEQADLFIDRNQDTDGDGEIEFKKHWRDNGHHHHHELSAAQASSMLQAASLDPDPNISKLSKDKELRSAIQSGKINKFWGDPGIKELFHDPKMIALNPQMSELWNDPRLINAWGDLVVQEFVRKPKLWKLWKTNPKAPELAKFNANKHLQKMMSDKRFIALLNDKQFEELALDKRFQKLLQDPVNMKMIRAMSSYRDSMFESYSGMMFPMQSDLK